ncbi:glycosyltransferase family 52 [Streptococcus uberis]|uniref:glycosyltransferase family 52 n=2 Tax=Streptococcus uberis TaxID=1349 RepID=UPI0012B5447B|nr:glycosyltransferase family 52 [Streptococcus uberis]MTB34729.1 CMP-N-acetylneuraminate-beta-galactosamide-alpha-2, 3-sialyltransferase [Streptococcus uberis]MTB37458.1 CMP-N-acetylneuraminate-beta-galactosamide-alpha-2, 3-sialyltransferase [Streptococcus uberis]MTB55532.1 CMP-N-acetylneuraminate-beta-galactosamide-alpha-2, 3-sialyltransferase [Streptococcus uberis]MTB60019.1 CMP-N-acetylneuraminate-beta-galactosamide-alpha-2, 3-sialyltransferase [Streptococcus uberis]MTB77553.1 CMP-N-acetyl
MNLIICHTPLQMMIADRIIKECSNESYYLINYYFKDNHKRKYYFNLIKKECVVTEEIQLENTKGLILQSIKQRIKKFNKKFEKVFVASIDSMFIQSVLSSVTFTELYTFDDGVANIFQDSLLFIDKTPKYLQIIKKLLKIKYDLKALKTISKLHYTIYNGKNIIQNCKKISLIDYKHFINTEASQSISILIGQPLYKESQKNIDYFTKVSNDYSIEFYYPHPRETYIIKGLKYINTNLIFEDYISYMIEKYQNIKLYTVFSSAILGYEDIENIETYLIPNNDFEKEQLFLRKFNIGFTGSTK